MLGSPSKQPIGAVCGSSARTDLAGGRWATIVPTGTSTLERFRLRRRGFGFARDWRFARDAACGDLDDIGLIAKHVDFRTLQAQPEPNRRAGQSIRTDTPFKKADVYMQIGFP
jgi:hypothetical protein